MASVEKTEAGDRSVEEEGNEQDDFPSFGDLDGFEVLDELDEEDVTCSEGEEESTDKDKTSMSSEKSAVSKKDGPPGSSEAVSSDKASLPKPNLAATPAAKTTTAAVKKTTATSTTKDTANTKPLATKVTPATGKKTAVVVNKNVEKTPVAGKTTVASKKTIAGTKTTPAATKVTPVSVKTTPVAVKTTPVAVKTTPVAVKTTPVAVKTTPVAVKTTPVAVKTTPVAVKTTPVAVKTTPVAVKTTPVAVKTTPVAVKTTPVAVKTTPVAVKKTPVVVKKTPVIVKKTPVAVKKTPTAVKKTPVAVKSTPTAAKTTPAAAKTTPVATKTTPVATKTTPVATKTTPVATKTTPASGKTTPVTVKATVGAKTTPVATKTTPTAVKTTTGEVKKTVPAKTTSVATKTTPAGVKPTKSTPVTDNDTLDASNEHSVAGETDSADTKIHAALTATSEALQTTPSPTNTHPVVTAAKASVKIVKPHPAVAKPSAPETKTSAVGKTSSAITKATPAAVIAAVTKKVTVALKKLTPAALGVHKNVKTVIPSSTKTAPEAPKPTLSPTEMIPSSTKTTLLSPTETSSSIPPTPSATTPTSVKSAVTPESKQPVNAPTSPVQKVVTGTQKSSTPVKVIAKTMPVKKVVPNSGVKGTLVKSQSTGDLQLDSSSPTMQKAKSTQSVAPKGSPGGSKPTFVKPTVGAKVVKTAAPTQKGAVKTSPKPASQQQTSPKPVVLKSPVGKVSPVGQQKVGVKATATLKSPGVKTVLAVKKRVQRQSKETMTEVQCGQAASTQTPGRMVTHPEYSPDSLEGDSVMLKRLSDKQERQLINRLKTVMLHPVQVEDLADPALRPFILNSHCLSARFLSSQKGVQKKGHLEIRYFSEADANTYVEEMQGLKLNSGKYLSAKILGQCGPWDGTLDDWHKKEIAEKKGLAEARCVYVHNIPADTTEGMLRLLYPEAIKLSLHLPKEGDKQAKGHALLEFGSAEEAKIVAESSKNYLTKIGGNVLQMMLIVQRCLKPDVTVPVLTEKKPKEDVAKVNEKKSGKRPADSSKEETKASPKKKAKSDELKYKGTDIKQFLLMFLQSNQTVPRYTYKSWGPLHKHMFRCEIRAVGYNYVGRATHNNKRLSQTKSAYDFVKYLIREGLVKESDIERCVLDLVNMGILPDPNEGKEDEKRKTESSSRHTSDRSPSPHKDDRQNRHGDKHERSRGEKESSKGEKESSRGDSQDRRHSRDRDRRQDSAEKSSRASGQTSKDLSPVRQHRQSANEEDKSIIELKSEITKQLAELQAGRVSDPDRLAQLAEKLQSVSEAKQKGQGSDREARDQNTGTTYGNQSGGRGRSPGRNRNISGGKSVSPDRNRNMPGRKSGSPDRSRNMPGRKSGSQDRNTNVSSRKSSSPERNRNPSAGRNASPTRNRNRQDRNTGSPSNKRNRSDGNRYSPDRNRNASKRSAYMPETDRDMSQRNTSDDRYKDSKKPRLNLPPVETDNVPDLMQETAPYIKPYPHTHASIPFRLPTLSQNLSRNAAIQDTVTQQLRGIRQDEFNRDGTQMGIQDNVTQQLRGLRQDEFNRDGTQMSVSQQAGFTAPNNSGQQIMGYDHLTGGTGRQDYTMMDASRNRTPQQMSTRGPQGAGGNATDRNSYQQISVRNQTDFARSSPQTMNSQQIGVISRPDITRRDTQHNYPQDRGEFGQQRFGSEDVSTTASETFDMLDQSVFSRGQPQSAPPAQSYSSSTASEQSRWPTTQQMQRKVPQFDISNPEALKGQLINRLRQFQEGQLSDESNILTQLAQQLMNIQKQEGEVEHNRANQQPLGNRTGVQTPGQPSRTHEPSPVPKVDHTAIRENLLLRMQTAGITSGTINSLVKGLKAVQQEEKGGGVQDYQKSTSSTSLQRAKQRESTLVKSSKYRGKLDLTRQKVQEQMKQKIQQIKMNQLALKMARKKAVAAQRFAFIPDTQATSPRSILKKANPQPEETPKEQSGWESTAYNRTHSQNPHQQNEQEYMNFMSQINQTSTASQFKVPLPLTQRGRTKTEPSPLMQQQGRTRNQFSAMMQQRGRTRSQPSPLMQQQGRTRTQSSPLMQQQGRTRTQSSPLMQQQGRTRSAPNRDVGRPIVTRRVVGGGPGRKTVGAEIPFSYDNSGTTQGRTSTYTPSLVDYPASP